MNYAEARMNVFEGHSLEREEWENQPPIRVWIDSDEDCIPYTSGLIVQDCNGKCDCKVGVYIPTKEDEYATDWQIVNEEKTQDVQ